jgi:hypothetical protein
VICPSGRQIHSVILPSSPIRENIPIYDLVDAVLEDSCPVPKEGRFAIVTNAGWDAVDAAASGA